VLKMVGLGRLPDFIRRPKHPLVALDSRFLAESWSEKIQTAVIRRIGYALRGALPPVADIVQLSRSALDYR
jgi:hypothetical protein